MSAPILATKLYVPPPRAKIVVRSRLIKQLNEGLRKLTLISAPAGFGKTTLVSEWVEDNERPTAWLSLDEGDNERSHTLSDLSCHCPADAHQGEKNQIWGRSVEHSSISTTTIH